LAVLVKFCRSIAGPDFNPARVCFRQAQPRDTGYHYELFRCPLEFGADATMLVLDRAQVDLRLTGSNRELAQLNEHIVVKYLAHSAKEDIVNRVKAAIIDALANGAVSENSIAAGLHTTPRNLHRKLQKEKTSFKVLLTDVRRELAQQYIQDPAALPSFAPARLFRLVHPRLQGLDRPPAQRSAAGSGVSGRIVLNSSVEPRPANVTGTPTPANPK
jgi:AraC-like DNA-binding protein